MERSLSPSYCEFRRGTSGCPGRFAVKWGTASKTTKDRPPHCRRMPPPETANTPQTEAATGRTEAAPVRTVAATVGTESRAPPRSAAEQTGTRRGSHTAQAAPNPPTAVDEGRISALNADCEPVSGGNARDFRTSPKHKVTHGRITNSPAPPSATSRPDADSSLWHLPAPHEAITQPHSTSASWTRSGHRSHPPHAHLTTPGTALHWAQPSVR